MNYHILITLNYDQNIWLNYCILCLAEIVRGDDPRVFKEKDYLSSGLAGEY